LRNRLPVRGTQTGIAEAGSKTNMKKTTIELTEEQYFFLKEKAIELQKQNQNASIVSIIRDLIQKDREEWAKAGKEKGR
jgi:hypothetical protein